MQEGPFPFPVTVNIFLSNKVVDLRFFWMYFLLSTVSPIFQVLHNLQMWTSTSNQLSYDEAKQNANQACKNIKLVGSEWGAFLYIHRQPKYFFLICKICACNVCTYQKILLLMTHVIWYTTVFSIVTQQEGYCSVAKLNLIYQILKQCSVA